MYNVYHPLPPPATYIVARSGHRLVMQLRTLVELRKFHFTESVNKDSINYQFSDRSNRYCTYFEMHTLKSLHTMHYALCTSLPAIGPFLPAAGCV